MRDAARSRNGRRRPTRTLTDRRIALSPNSAGRVATIQYSGPANSGLQFTETYGYVAAGGVASKALGIQGPLSAILTGNWAYDSEGRVTTVTYPRISNTNSNPAAVYTYAFDSMGRLNTMTDQNNATLVSGVTYNAANQIVSIAGTLSETRTYNANLQVVELVSGSYHYKYNYSATQNNGRITSLNDVISGETITYQYDSLNRLINASGTGDPQGNWTQAFTFDGFGNLSQKTSSNAPALSVAIDATTNRLASNGAGYDANGNLTAYGTGVFAASYSYDVENRLNLASVSGASYGYGYDSLNERVFSGTVSGSTYTNELIYFYGPDGKKLGVWSYSASAIQNVSVNQWFAGRLLKGEDRLQSVGKYFPYGEDRNSPNPPNPANDQEKFATYTRDSATGLDYAVNRYYNSQIGRFMTTDQAQAIESAPQSWNRYGYAGNDPANGYDPSGLLSCLIFADSDVPYAYANWDEGVIEWGLGVQASYLCYNSGGGAFMAGGGGGGGVDCNQLGKSTGLPGFNYAEAQRIWKDGNPANVKNGTTIAALAAVTWQGEDSNFSRYPNNRVNGPGSVDVGPFQINTYWYYGKFQDNSAVFGTNLGKGAFNGNPDANIAAGISILENGYKSNGDNEAGLYTGANNPARAARQATYDKYKNALKNLFSNIDCFR